MQIRNIVFLCAAVLLSTGAMATGTHGKVPDALVAPVVVDSYGINPMAFEVKFTDTNTEENGYIILFSNSPGGPFNNDIINTEPGTGTVITYRSDSGYEPNTVVYAKIATIIIDTEAEGFVYEEGPFSEVFTMTTLASWPPPPTDFKAQLKTDYFKLTWTDNSPAGHPFDEDHWIIQRYLVGTSLVKSFTVPANVTSLIDYSLDTDNEYLYTIQSVNNFQSPAVDLVTTSITSPSNLYLRPPLLANVEGASPHDIRVTFVNTNYAERPTGYIVRYGPLPWEPFFDFVKVYQSLDSGSVLTIQTNTEQLETYSRVWVRVAAVRLDENLNVVEENEFSGYGNSTTLQYLPLPATSFFAQAEGDHINLSWHDNSPSTGEKAEAYWKLTRIPAGTGDIHLPANTTSFVDDNVLPNVIYTYRLQAMNAFDVGDQIVTLSAKLGPLPDAPVAKAATYVGPASFHANWQPSPDALRYELDVYDVITHAFLTGYEARAVAGPTHKVKGIDPGKKYAYVVRTISLTGRSQNSNVITVTPVVIRDLTLDAVCSYNPTVTKRWKIINPNPFPVSIWWSVENTDQSGTLEAAAGDSFFETQTVAGQHKFRISWYNDKQVVRTYSKNPTNQQCAAPSGNVPLARASAAEELTTETDFSIHAYPNPLPDKLHIFITSSSDKNVDIEIINLQGQSMLTRSIESNRDVEVDVTSFGSGIYVLRARQELKQGMVKVVKK